MDLPTSIIMTTNADRAVIEPVRAKRDPVLPSTAVLVLASPDLELFLKRLPVRPARSHKVFLADVHIASLEGIPFTIAGPLLGAPQAVMAIEKLIALGVREVLAVGWCGSLQPRVRIGDVVLPTDAICEEGTSQHYPINIERPGPAPDLLYSLRTGLEERAIRIHCGPAWTTDAPFRETVGKVSEYRRLGILAVDMEASALFTVAMFRGIRLALAMVVSDDLSELKWVHGFRDTAFLDAREKLADATLDIIRSRGSG